MAVFRVRKNAIANDVDIYHTQKPVNMLKWIAEHVPEVRNTNCLIQVNGIAVANSMKMSNQEMYSATNMDVGLFDNVDIMSSPQGVELAWWAVALIAAGAAAISLALTPTPEIPNNLGKSQSSPNNQLNAAQNEFRPREAIPDIAGSLPSYPDFLQNSYYVYENNNKKFVEVFCIGVGYHDVATVRDGETDFDDVEGSTFTVYQPNQTVPDLADVRASTVASNQVIIPANDPARQIGINNLTLTSPSTITFPSFVTPNLSVGDSIKWDLDYFEPGGSTVMAFNQTLTVQSISGQDVIFQETTVPDSDTNAADGNYVNLTTDPAGAFYVLQGSDTTEIRHHVVMPRGIRSATGEELTVNFTITAIEVDSAGNEIGSPITSNESITGNTLDAQRVTYSLTVTSGRYKSSIRRTDSASNGDINETRLERLESVRYYTPNFGNITTLITNRRAGAQESSSRNKVNADVTRRLELFDPNTGTFDTGNFTATRSFAQYVMYMLVNRGGVDLANIDYQTLFAISDSLSDAQLGYFDFTFDSSDVSLRDRVKTACNVARVKTYNVGNTWNFVREEAKQARSALFCRRNLTARNSSQNWTSFRDNDYDSIELKYVDPDTNSEAYIRRRINPTTGAIESGLGGRVQEMNLAGCRNVLQATNRCELEIRRIKYQRYSVNDIALSDALNVGVGERVGWADINDAEIFHGEILEQDSATSFITSEPFTPDGVSTYYVFITDEEGNTTNSVVATARSDGNKYGFEASGLTAFTADGYAVQLGSMYLIAADSFESADFILTGRGSPNQAGEVEISMSVYDERMFSED